MYFIFHGPANFQFIYPSSPCCMTQSLTNIYNCFVNDFEDEQYYETLSEIDVRAQLEVSVLKIYCYTAVIS